MKCPKKAVGVVSPSGAAFSFGISLAPERDHVYWNLTHGDQTCEIKFPSPEIGDGCDVRRGVGAPRPPSSRAGPAR